MKAHFLPGLFLLCLLSIINSSLASQVLSSLHLYAEEHTRESNLAQIHVSSKQTSNNGTVIYLHAGVESVKVCFARNQKNSAIPVHAEWRSYCPINGWDPSIGCYHTEKVSLTDAPTVQPPMIDLSSAEVRKYKKQTQFLINEFNLIKWLYNMGTQVEKELSNLKDAGKSVVSLHSIDEFSVMFTYNDGIAWLQKVWKRHSSKKAGCVISKKLGGKGLHQRVTYKILLQYANPIYDINSEECHVSILETLPHTTYVDVDELKSKGLKIRLESGEFKDGVGYINIEKPAYQSRQYQYQLSIPWGKWKNTHINTYQIQIPVHFRYPSPYILYPPYQKAQIEYVEVDLEPITKALIVCRGNSTQDTIELTQDYLIDRGTAYVPVGDANMKSTVNVVTLGSLVICAVLLVRKLRK